jgi:hypothetical protein
MLKRGIWENKKTTSKTNVGFFLTNLNIKNIKILILYLEEAKWKIKLYELIMF